MFCTEMDGIDSLNDVVIILASNRADLIDPAIIRPGRIDRKIKVNRPTKEGAREIYKIYLAENLPYDPAMVKEAGSVRAAIDGLVEGLIDQQFTHRDENRFLEVTLRSGRKETLYRGDLISGAIIASIVERAKGLAIKRAIATMQEEGISASDLSLSLNAEYAENDIFPPTDITEDWLKLIDYESENVVACLPRAGQFTRRCSVRKATAPSSKYCRRAAGVGGAVHHCVSNKLEEGMNRVFGIETEYGITVDGVDNVDVVSESIELVRRYTEHGNLMKWDYSLEDPHQDARGGVPRGGAAPGHGRVGLLRDRQEPAAEFRGDQERPRAQQRGAFLQRPRAPGIFHPGMHPPARTRRAGQGGRAHPRRVRPAA